ncbi:MAG: fumarate hydratase C-terminal domain-containing protein [Paludibacteraceae bacterium]
MGLLLGGPADILAEQNIKKVECLEYPKNIGMEAIWKIEVEDFPAFILVDDKGNDFFQQIKKRRGLLRKKLFSNQKISKNSSKRKLEEFLFYIYNFTMLQRSKILQKRFYFFFEYL